MLMLITRILRILAVLLSLANASHAWHGYNSTLVEQMKKEKCNNGISENNCPCFADATKPYSSDFADRMGLWPNLMSAFDYEQGEVLYGSEIALEMIWKSQNPEDCSKAKYIISGGWPYGFGSRLHEEARGLAIAINLGRVYLFHPDGDNIFWETNTQFCRDQNMYNLHCYYQFLSKCTYQDALRAYGDVNRLPNHFVGDFQDSFLSDDARQSAIDRFAGEQSFNLIFTYGGPKYDTSVLLAPRQVHYLIDCSPVVNLARHYWWKAVSSAYVARPSLATVRELQRLSNLPIGDTRNCVSMFVRHGDKGIEMKLHDFDEYRDVAEYMWRSDFVPGTTLREYPRFPKNGTMFITTEDPQVLSDADAWGKENNWNIVYTDLFDRAKMTAFKTHDEQHKKGTVAVHDDLEYLSMMLNMQYAVQCEAWVCTLASNSCRLMDELRVTVGGKLNRHYADLSTETCSRPPCLNGTNVYNFFTRRLRNGSRASFHG